MYCYPTCGTCRKARRWLDDHGIAYKEINIAENPPDVEELKHIIAKSGLPAGKFFNTSGRHYRDGDYKNRRKQAAEQEWINWLAADGLLIKRPLVFDQTTATVGFSEKMFTEKWLTDEKKI